MAELLRRHTPALSWLLLAACLALFLSAGNWQYDKGVAKQERIQAFQAAVDAPPKPLGPQMLSGDGNDFDRVRVRGQVGGQHYLLDNQIRNGRPGIEVYTPLRTPDGEHLLLALGWLPYPDARRQLPDLPPITGSRVDGNGADGAGADTVLQFTGMLAPPPAHGLRLGRNWPEQPGPDKLMSYFDLAQISADAGVPLVGRVLWLDPDPAGPWQRDWQPAQGMPPERHYAYAWQWWSMAVASVIVFFVLHYRRRKRK